MTRHAPKDGRTGRTALTPGRVGILALVALTLVFIFENTQSTEIRLLIPKVTMPLYLALLAAALLGGVCGAYLSRRRRP
ncbi:DUF1049 domain-containing protein [Streptomyces sp. NPDC048507]|uniref:DUF1049 domain-containing protein n=1 Tax=Streptomyces sp. NPDC048507 TaxID=3365560 RepID=UPI00371325DE